MKEYQHIIDGLLEELGLSEVLDAWNPNPTKDTRLSTAPTGRPLKRGMSVGPDAKKPHPCPPGKVYNRQEGRCVDLRGAKRA